MNERADWRGPHERRMAEPGADEAYEAARLSFELGKSVRDIREQRGWTQTQLAEASG
jgi:ribosome-binding protein aMBF1 (putative translation factor)